MVELNDNEYHYQYKLNDNEYHYYCQDQIHNIIFKNHSFL
ncbi:tRNA pseudouridine synthase A [Bacillus sp. TS-2]|nr:tRNA pseudouridine synthase A [Bacillus sp. TS-2]